MIEHFLLDRERGVLYGALSRDDIPLPAEFRNADLEVIRRYACYRLKRPVVVMEVAYDKAA